MRLYVFVALVLLMDLAVMLAGALWIGANYEALRGSWWAAYARNEREMLSNLLFIIGAALAGIGGLIAMGQAETLIATTFAKLGVESGPAFTDRLARERMKMRERQLSEGMLLLLIGFSLIAISLALIYVAR